MTDKCSTCRNYVGGACVVTGLSMEPGEWCSAYVVMMPDRLDRAYAAALLTIVAVGAAVGTMALFNLALYLGR